MGSKFLFPKIFNLQEEFYQMANYYLPIAFLVTP